METELTFVEELRRNQYGKRIALYLCSCGGTREARMDLVKQKSIKRCEKCSRAVQKKCRAESWKNNSWVYDEDRDHAARSGNLKGAKRLARFWLIRDRWRVLKAWKRYAEISS